MDGEVNTNAEALRAIKNSLVRFQERIIPLQSELAQAFQEIDGQLADGIKRKLRQIDAARSKDKEELEQLRRVVNNYNQQKADFIQLFSSFFSSEAGDVDRGVASLASCISILEQYLGTDISFDAGYDQEKTFKKR